MVKFYCDRCGAQTPRHQSEIWVDYDTFLARLTATARHPGVKTQKDYPTVCEPCLREIITKGRTRNSE